MNISEIESIDGGAYTCRAINTVGTITHTARVNVYGKHFYFIIQCPIFHQTTTYLYRVMNKPKKHYSLKLVNELLLTA